MTRLVSAGAATMAAAVAIASLASCSRAKASDRNDISFAQVSQEYLAAISPANASLSAFVPLALAYIGGSAVGLDAKAHGTASAVTDAAHQIHAIAAPEPIQPDLSDVGAALDALRGDLLARASARGGAIQPAIARLVADAGRESAADDVVRLALTAATTPTTAPAVTITPPVPSTTEPPTVPSLAPAPTTTTIVAVPTTVPPRTTTTRPRITTTLPPATTLPAPTTTVAPTTSTTRPRTTTTFHLL